MFFYFYFWDEVLSLLTLSNLDYCCHLCIYYCNIPAMVHFVLNQVLVNLINLQGIYWADYSCSTMSSCCGEHMSIQMQKMSVKISYIQVFSVSSKIACQVQSMANAHQYRHVCQNQLHQGFPCILQNLPSFYLVHLSYCLPSFHWNCTT